MAASAFSIAIHIAGLSQKEVWLWSDKAARAEELAKRKRAYAQLELLVHHIIAN